VSRRLTENRSRIIVALLAAAVVGLIAGYALKAPCRDGRWTGQQYSRLCYSDIVPLYGARGLATGGFPYLSTDLEYPAGTGLYVGVVAHETSTLSSFFDANAVGLAIAGLAAAAALAAMARDPKRVLLYALGPALVLYAFHNWDLLAVGLATLSLYAFWRGSDPWAGLLLGLGAATKLFPAFILPALVLAAWRRDRRPPWRLGLMFVLGVALLNVPLMIANLDGWKYPWVFQSERGPNFETSWYVIQRHLGPSVQSWKGYPQLVNYLSGALFVIGTGVLMGREARRERIRPYVLAFGILVLFLLTAKVFSPQYALWLLPFFALLGMPWWSYVVFAVTDAAVWIAVSAYFLAIQYGHGDQNFRFAIVEGAVWARYVALILVLWASRRADELVREPDPRATEPAPVPLTA
jgi:uncharacterized membrane protein